MFYPFFLRPFRRRKTKTTRFSDVLKKNLCVILVDMQEYYIRQLRDGDADRIIPQQKKILEWCANNDIPVVVLEFRGEGQTREDLNVLVSKVPTHIHIVKTTDSGFTYTILDEWLKSKEIKSLLLMGINACHCVKDTAADAVNLGYKIYTSSDLIGGMNHHDDDNAIGWYSKNGTIIELQPV
jgi:nicotinamidase-related amidase